MRVEFFYGHVPVRANSDGVATVAIRPLQGGYLLELDREQNDITDATVATIYRRWRDEINLRPRPEEIWCTGPNKEGMSHMRFSLAITQQMLPEWKLFLRNLLSKREAWATMR